MKITIERVTNVEQCRTCHDLAALVWGEDSACSIPQMIVHALYGGVVLLAYVDDKPAGFLFSFPAHYKESFVLWSHETAVIPVYLHQGIGTELKLEQKRLAEQMGYKTVAWTFDPFISRNAHFNLNKLHACISDYKVNAYGIMGDLINGALETDRFIVLWPVSQSFIPPETTDWPVQSNVLLDLERPVPNVGNTQPIQLEFDRVEKGNKEVIETRIPLNGEEIIRYFPKTASAWRLAFRNSAQQLMDAGYGVTRFERKSYYGVYYWTLR